MRPYFLIVQPVLALVLATAPVRAELVLIPVPEITKVPVLGKGINTDTWVEWRDPAGMIADPAFLSVYPDWPRYVTPERLVQLRSEGFDFVRMPVDPEPMMLLGPGEARNRLIAQIRTRVTELHAAGLTVIVDLHTIPWGEVEGTTRIVEDDAFWSDYLRIVSEVGYALDGFDPKTTLFEPINEPVHDCDAIGSDRPGRWNVQVLELHAAARAAAPELTLVLSGACWGGIDGLQNIDPAAFKDDNIIYSFHSYEPIAFTHQEAAWTGSDFAFLTGVPYPPSKLDDATAAGLIDAALSRVKTSTDGFATSVTRESLTAVVDGYRRQPDDIAARDVSLAVAWADYHRIPTGRLLLGEFGTTGGNQGSAIRAEDRLALLSDKRTAAERAGIPWAVWSWIGPLAIAEDSPSRPFLPGVCQALALRCAQ
jgi:endoglucanase